ncbi:MAG: phage holin family protein [Vulcanimicrobiaceae bacterium]
MNLLLRFIINAIALYLIAKFVPGFNHQIGVWSALIAALVFGIVNMLLGPILRLLSAPITWLTHGLFSVVINFVLFWVMTLFVPALRATGETIAPWVAYLIGAIIMMIVSTLVHQSTRTEAGA